MVASESGSLSRGEAARGECAAGWRLCSCCRWERRLAGPGVSSVVRKSVSAAADVNVVAREPYLQVIHRREIRSMVCQARGMEEGGGGSLVVFEVEAKPHVVDSDAWDVGHGGEVSGG